MLLLALIQEIEIIGEAAIRISDESRKALYRAFPGRKSLPCETG